jgi:hypothetical protein
MKINLKAEGFLNFIKSNTAAVTLALMGVLVEAFHVYHTVMLISDLPGWQKIAQAITAAIFISGGLFYFVINFRNATGESTEVTMRYRKAINYFTGLSIGVNTYYWGSVLLLKPLMEFTETAIIWHWYSPNYIALTIAVPLSIVIPLIIKTYAGEVTPIEKPIPVPRLKPGAYKLELVKKYDHSTFDCIIKEPNKEG